MLAALGALVCALVLTMAGTAVPSVAVDAGSECKRDARKPAEYPRNGKPLRNAPVANGDYFSFPNRSSAEQGAIMNRVLNTINSTWGTRRKAVYEDQPVGCTFPNGTTDEDLRYIARWEKLQGVIRMATWSFNHAGVKDALINAERRGVQTQIIAAYSVNKYGVKGSGLHRNWRALRNYLRTYGKNTGSGAWECGGACRGAGGAPHSKYFLFNDAGNNHIKNIVVQSSMNLTPFAVKGQWNQATVMRNGTVYNDFTNIFQQSRPSYPGSGYRSWDRGTVTNIFYPGGRLNTTRDPVLGILSRVSCAGGTRIRAINYAIHGTRGTTIAKRLRGLWSRGCNVRVIYSVSSRPVMSILRNRSGRGPIPVRQSVIKNRSGEIVKYNHSKWLAVGGKVVNAGSANWSNISYSSDEQMQNVNNATRVSRYFAAFDKTWRQRTSRTPSIGRVYVNGRMVPGIPEEPTYGSGQYRYLTPFGS